MTNFKYLQKMFFLLVMGFSMNFMCVACGDDEDNESVTDPSKNTTDIAVTGKVDKYGCTYANISGYANLNLLPTGTGNPEIGIELLLADYEDGYADKEITNTMTGNSFTVKFDDLYPDSEYKYRSFVKYGGLTHYGEYRTFTTRPAYNVTSTGDVSDVTYATATFTTYVQLTSVDADDNIKVGVAYATSKDAIHSDSTFRMKTVYTEDDDECVITIDGLFVNTTYYYASFTFFNGVYAFSNIKSFTTKNVAVDLGLSVKWATCNVGAFSPEEYGDYFAWSETKPKSSYFSDNSITYGLSPSELESRGIIGSDGNLTAAHDAATANWGGSWRMPTFDEIKELLYNCIWKWTTCNGVNGQLVTGPNGNSIFLPAAGYRVGIDFCNRGLDGEYWSATLDEIYSFLAYNLDFSSDYNLYFNNYDRYYGFTVRPVTE